MREILFRGKRLDNGEWAEGNLFIPDKVTRTDVPTEILMGTNIVRISYEVDPSTVGQYTGLTDKNGRRIFEGDIISAKCKFDNVSYNFIVKFGECGGVKNVLHNVGFLGFYFDIICEKIKYDFRKDPIYWVDSDNYECEVIGNVYDNLELLEGGDTSAAEEKRI